MKDKFCKNCFYLTSKESKDFPLSDYHTKYVCELHKLYNDEVMWWPSSQRCDDWTSIISGNRNLKLEELGII
jgi:hypothetical protein